MRLKSPDLFYLVWYGLLFRSHRATREFSCKLMKREFSDEPFGRQSHSSASQIRSLVFCRLFLPGDPFGSESFLVVLIVLHLPLSMPTASTSSTEGFKVLPWVFVLSMGIAKYRIAEYLIGFTEYHCQWRQREALNSFSRLMVSSFTRWIFFSNVPAYPQLQALSAWVSRLYLH